MQSSDWQWLAEHHFKDIDNTSEWGALFAHLFRFGDRATPTQQWLKGLKPLLEPIGKESFVRIMTQLTLYFCKNEEWFLEKKSHLVRGIIWTGSILKEDERVYDLIAQLISKAYTPSFWGSALSAKTGNTGINALVSTKTPEAIQTLLSLKTRTKYTPLLKAIQKGLQLLTHQIGLSEEEILERSIPDFGLQQQQLERKIGEFTVQLWIEDYHKLHTEWLNESGKSQKSLPTTLKKNKPSAIDQWKIDLQNIKSTLQTQRYHLENAWRKDRKWKWEDWKKYLIEHPLMCILTHQLIWRITENNVSSSVWVKEDTLLGIEGNQVNPSKNAIVQLWHPVEVSVEEVLAWRNFMFEHQIVQPFKQAFREVYLLTEAEQNTLTYSNRFSAHILQNNKLWALTRQREWTMKRPYEQNYTSITLSLPAYQLTASLDTTFNHFEYATTQRIKFISEVAKEIIPLQHIPKIAFSEVMRDIDLFVAVCSIGADPNWNGSEDYQSYWYDYAFGEKSDTMSAKIRKNTLEKIVPRLKIATQCSFEGNFLIVKGKIRTYKINIGSGNILMKPNDEYLCIVPDRSEQGDTTKTLYLPFEGDSILTLILSKAFLLVEDDKISDSTILSQINRAI